MKELAPYLWDNPMLIELNRFWGRNFSVQRNRTQATAMILLVCILVAPCLFLGIIGALNAIAVVFLSFVLFLILPIGVMYRAISGERENRTWDFLLVSPLNAAQIVLGKFIVGLVPLGLVTVLTLVLGFIAMLTTQVAGQGSFAGGRQTAELPAFMLLTFLFLSMGIFTAAVTLAVSARSKRAFSALGTSLGIMFLLHMASILTVSLSENTDGRAFLVSFSIYNTMNLLSQQAGYYDRIQMAQISGVAVGQMVAMLLLSAGIIAFAIKTLPYPDNLHSSFPRKK